jgi:TRAP-type C4-dicarboxylate transport system substrate-binding protein
MKKFVTILLVVTLVLALVGCSKKNAGAPSAGSGNAALEKNYELSFSMHTAAETPIGRFYQAMFDDISRRTNGHVKVTVYGGGTLAAAPDVVEMVRDGGCDIGWVFTSFYYGQFPLSDVITIPLQDASSVQQGTNVLWDLHDTYKEMAAEWDAFHVLMMYANPISYIYSKKPVASPADLRGMTLRSTSGGITECLKAWGANVISAPPVAIYDGMSKGNINGFTFEPTGIPDYSLTEVTPYVTDMYLYQGPFVTIMNKETYNSLPREYQAAFDAWTGREASLKFADMYQTTADANMQDFLKTSQKVAVSAAARAEFQKAADAFGADWAAKQSVAGFDAKAYYDFCRNAYKKYAN